MYRQVKAKVDTPLAVSNTRDLKDDREFKFDPALFFISQKLQSVSKEVMNPAVQILFIQRTLYLSINFHILIYYQQE